MPLRMIYWQERKTTMVGIDRGREGDQALYAPLLNCVLVVNTEPELYSYTGIFRAESCSIATIFLFRNIVGDIGKQT